MCEKFPSSLLSVGVTIIVRRQVFLGRTLWKKSSTDQRDDSRGANQFQVSGPEMFHMCHGRNHEEGNGTIVQPFVDSKPEFLKMFNIISKVGVKKKKGRSGDSAPYFRRRRRTRTRARLTKVAETEVYPNFDTTEPSSVIFCDEEPSEIPPSISFDLRGSVTSGRFKHEKAGWVLRHACAAPLGRGTQPFKECSKCGLMYHTTDLADSVSPPSWTSKPV